MSGPRVLPQHGDGGSNCRGSSTTVGCSSCWTISARTPPPQHTKPPPPTAAAPALTRRTCAHERLIAKSFF